MVRAHGLRLSVRQRAALYGSAGLAWVSGAGWMLLHRFFQAAGEFGPVPHPAEPGLLKIHGAAAFLYVAVFGALVPLHIQRGWRQIKNRASGVFMAGVSLFWILSGWGLYYVGHEGTRAFLARTHGWSGLLLPLILLAHVALGRRAVNRR